jgi:MoaA/NifB/PqqE/SkfB family radical SAM enzyme
MSYITTDKITSINAELSNYCNAACPMCARYFIDGKLVKDKVNSSHTSLEFIKDKIGIDIIKQLKNFTSCGNFGDGAMNPECVEIYGWVREINPTARLLLHSNGGARNKKFWENLARLDVQVTFAIDGLEDTNHLYRRNVKWNKLMENVGSYIDAGGKANWEMLIFKHNEHQVDECRKLSKQMGIKWFTAKQSARWSDFDSEGVWRDLDQIQVDDYILEKSTELQAPGIGEGGNSQKVNIDKETINTKKIKCYANNIEKNFIEIYLAVNGDVSPCCWLGDLRMHESKNIIKDYEKVNLNHTPLDDILKGDYFSALEKGIRGDLDAHRLHTCYFNCGVKD